MARRENVRTRKVEVAWRVRDVDMPATIVYGLRPSPFGRCVIGMAGRDICHLSFVDGDDARQAELALRAHWPAAKLTRDDGAAAACGAIFDATRTNAKGPLRLLVAGTLFQLRIWRALMDIPAGNVTTYARLAADAGRPLAARAAGTACGRNPVAFLIPCHRVIAANGGTGGYAWGTQKKEAILASEGVRLPLAARRS